MLLFAASWHGSWYLEARFLLQIHEYVEVTGKERGEVVLCVVLFRFVPHGFRAGLLCALTFCGRHFD